METLEKLDSIYVSHFPTYDHPKNQALLGSFSLKPDSYLATFRLKQIEDKKVLQEVMARYAKTLQAMLAPLFPHTDLVFTVNRSDRDLYLLLPNDWSLQDEVVFDLVMRGLIARYEISIITNSRPREEAIFSS